MHFLKKRPLASCQALTGRNKSARISSASRVKAVKKYEAHLERMLQLTVFVRANFRQSCQLRRDGELFYVAGPFAGRFCRTSTHVRHVHEIINRLLTGRKKPANIGGSGGEIGFSPTRLGEFEIADFVVELLKPASSPRIRTRGS